MKTMHVLIALGLLTSVGCECPRGGAFVTITELDALTPGGRLYGLEELRANPAPNCAEFTAAVQAGGDLPGTVLETQAIDDLGDPAAAGVLFQASGGDKDWKGCPGGSATGTFIVRIFDVPTGCSSADCFPATPMALACAEGVSISLDSTDDLTLPAAPLP